MKYSIGDKVKIRKDLNVDTYYGVDNVTKEMTKYLGKRTEIKEIKEVKLFFREYKLDIDNEEYYWTDEMLEPVNKNVSDGHIQYILNGDKTIVIEHYTDEKGNYKYRKGIARRNPIDPYSKAIGLIMAIADSYGIDKSTIHIGECKCKNKVSNINNPIDDFIDKFINDKIAVHCETRKDSDNFLNFVCKYSDKFTKVIPVFHYYVYDRFKSNTCYFYKGEKLYYDTKDNCINGKYGIIKYKDLQRFYKEI